MNETERISALEKDLKRVEKKIDLWFKLYLNQYSRYGSDAPIYPLDDCIDEFLELYNIDKNDLVGKNLSKFEPFIIKKEDTSIKEDPVPTYLDKLEKKKKEGTK